MKTLQEIESAISEKAWEKTRQIQKTVVGGLASDNEVFSMYHNQLMADKFVEMHGLLIDISATLSANITTGQIVVLSEDRANEIIKKIEEL